MDVTPLGVADRIRTDGTVCQWIAGDGTEHFVSNLLFRFFHSVHLGFALTIIYHDHLPSPTTTSHAHPLRSVTLWLFPITTSCQHYQPSLSIPATIFHFSPPLPSPTSIHRYLPPPGTTATIFHSPLRIITSSPATTSAGFSRT